MGAIADAFMAYAQPLIDGTDGSPEELRRAITLSQLCYNLALLPEDDRAELLRNARESFELTDEEFEDFRRNFILPMIQRHEEMFPRLHQRASVDSIFGDLSPDETEEEVAPAAAPPKIDRYAPCPCGSGEKYKFCCGKKRR